MLTSHGISLAKMRHSPIVGSMLGQRRRRWTKIEPAMGGCLVFAGRGLDLCRLSKLSRADSFNMSKYRIGCGVKEYLVGRLCVR